MDKTAIKNFAIAARRNLIKAVRQKAYDIGIFEDKAVPITEVQGGYIYNGVSYDRTQSEQRKRLVSAIDNHADGKGYAHGYNQVMEEAAYTWFNRLIAMRFMELNGYLPSNIRILSSEIEGRLEPDCIREAEHLDFVDMRIVNELKDNADKLYRYILIAQCNAMSDILPKMFRKIADYTELLLPDRLYSKAGYIVYDLVHDITEKDFTEQVEIIGWLYQYYISEKKDEVFAGLKKNVKITKENIPAATQLFTPDWIVKYMVENSLGRLWIEKLKSHKNSRFHAKNADGTTVEYPISEVSFLDYAILSDKWKYYLDEALQSEEVENKLNELIDKNLDPRDIKVIDPCMGSGHILVYAFDVFHQIYASLGYAAREIPNLILTYNLYGLDIDGRAGQLAYFALMMKARSYDRRFFRQDNIPQPKVYAMSESDGIKAAEFSSLPHDIKTDADYLIGLFADAKEYGSILKIDKDIDYDKLTEAVQSYALSEQLTLDSVGFEERKASLFVIVEIARLLTQKYDVVVTNPPYMGSSGMGGTLAEYVKKHFPDSKSDLFAVFIEKCGEMLKPNGLQAMITQHAFMFLSSYEKLRTKLLLKDIVNMAHLGARAFEEIGGEVVQTTAFVLRKSNVKGYNSTFVRLVDFNSQQAKEQAFLSGEHRYIAQKENFAKIPGSPVAYWVSERVMENYEQGKLLGDIAAPRKGNSTSNNNRFLRLWYEVAINNENFDCTEIDKEQSKIKRWYPYNKGGGYRKWYGNNEYMIDWYDDAAEIRKIETAVIANYQYFMKECLTWSTVSSSNFSIRYCGNGFIFDNGGCCIFELGTQRMYFLGLLNSNVFKYMFGQMNPTLNFQSGEVAKFPILDKNSEAIDACVAENIAISKADWDSFETSWDFKTHPLIGFKSNYEEAEPLLVADDLIEGTVVTEWSKVSAPIAHSFDAWERFTDEQFSTLKSNETELNRIFIDIYGLQNELTPEVADKDVTIRCADLARDVKSFISYAVGCMFGRYSLDEDGLVFAGGTFDSSRYKTFTPEKENIIPITAEDYHLDNDIVTRFVEFVKTVYGAQTLEENLQFIASALYPNADGTERAKIRRYFVNDFYKDHVKIYQKKPIYWLFDSNGCSDAGKQDAFKALIYLHRYDKYTAARVRVDYLHRLQAIYNGEINRCNTLIEMTTDVREVAAYKKQIETLQKKLTECRAYDPAIAHLAHKALDLDLDDGVTVNYAKFQGVEVELGGSKGTSRVDLLGKI